MVFVVLPLELEVLLVDTCVVVALAKIVFVLGIELLGDGGNVILVVEVELLVLSSELEVLLVDADVVVVLVRIVVLLPYDENKSTAENSCL